MERDKKIIKLAVFGIQVAAFLIDFTTTSTASGSTSNLYATGLSNCPKLSDNPRIKTVEYTVVNRAVDE